MVKQPKLLAFIKVIRGIFFEIFATLAMMAIVFIIGLFISKVFYK